MSRIFVYGSLRGPGVNHHYLLSSRFIAKAYAKGALYRINGYSYPALLEGEAWITGELYEVDAQTEKQLDELGTIRDNENEVGACVHVRAFPECVHVRGILGG